MIRVTAQLICPLFFVFEYMQNAGFLTTQLIEICDFSLFFGCTELRTTMKMVGKMPFQYVRPEKRHVSVCSFS